MEVAFERLINQVLHSHSRWRALFGARQPQPQPQRQAQGWRGDSDPAWAGGGTAWLQAVGAGQHVWKASWRRWPLVRSQAAQRGQEQVQLKTLRLCFWRAEQPLLGKCWVHGLESRCRGPLRSSSSTVW